jgi:hypothetical protein
VWTAVDPTAVIGPGQFDVFSVELGPLPTGTDRLAFDVAQTYADGQVVDWADGSDAAHPAPVVQLRQIAGAAMIAAPADPPQMAQPPAAAVAAAVEPAPKPDNSRRVTAGLTLGIVLILLGAAAAAVQQRRRPAETD